MNQKKEMSMEARLLLAFALMGVVLFVSQYFMPAPPKPKAPEQQKAAAQALVAPPVKPAVEQAKPAAPAATPSTTPVKAEAESLHVVETDLARITFSNRGAVVKSWILKKFQDSAGKPLEMVNQTAIPKTGAPFSLVFRTQVPVDVNQALFSSKVSADGLGIDFEYSDGRVRATKSFRFQKDSYLSQVSSEFFHQGAAVPHFLVWRGGFGDPTVYNATATQHTVHFDASAQKLTIHEAKEAQDGPVSHGGNFAFAGLEDQYFAAVLLPKGTSQVDMTTYSDPLPAPPDNAEQPHIGTAVSGGAQNSFELFVGPKDYDLLQKVSPKLAQLIDWGWFGVLAKPLFLVLNWTNNQVTHNYGWAIILITVVLNILLLPLKFSSMKSAKKMQSLQPELKKIQEKYSSLPLRDPRRTEQNEEMMSLYKKHGVNPMGGCLPLLIQMPFLFAFYKVLTVAIEMRGASWLWVNDLSQPETIAIRLLPVLLIVTQFILQKMTPTAGMDPAQARIMLIMPLFLGFMFYYQSAGLVLYWLTGNLIGIVQQWLMNRTNPVAATAPSSAPAKKATRK